MLGRFLPLLPSIALGALRFRQPPPAPGPAPGPAGPDLEGFREVLPNGTDVMVGGHTFEVFHIPQYRPTIAPDRLNNEMPVMTPLEKVYDQLGPTAPPPRDCVRTPGISMCGCKGMITACHEESYMCEVQMQDLKKEATPVLRNNYQSKFAHPLLNTLQVNSSRWGHIPYNWPDARHPQPSAQCVRCFQDMAASLPHNEPDNQDLQLLQASKGAKQTHFKSMMEKMGLMPAVYQPEETGWRIYYEGPSNDGPGGGIMSGICSAAEMQGLEECLNFFWSCDANRERLQSWIEHTNAETKWIDTHPGVRPGGFR